MSTVQHNAGWSGTYGPAIAWEEFDRLPWSIRAVYCFAAYDYSASSAPRLLQFGMSEEQVARAIRKRMRQRLQAEVLRLYGPAHPQAPH